TPSSSELYLFSSNDPATSEIYTLSLHDALPISWRADGGGKRRARLRGDHVVCADGAAWHPGADSPAHERRTCQGAEAVGRAEALDRKSTRLNSSHVEISYAVFCLK